MRKNNYIYIEHIKNCIGKIISYTHEMTENQFIKNEIVQDAVIRNFEIIGEATKKISKDFREKHTNIQWKEIAGMRDVLIHDYISVDMWIVWETVQKYIPKLKINIENILKNTNL